MKNIFILIIAAFSTIVTNAQSESPKEVTPEILNKIKVEVEKEVVKFRQSLAKDENITKTLLDFQTDTFRIHRINDATQEVDYSTPGISNAVYEMGKSYDLLLNKYYNKLLKKLKGNDKTVLIKAQKAWLTFQKLEQDLIGTLGKAEYSGGGTIQSNIRASQYTELIIKRTCELFWYENTEFY